jgi:growth factor-regulated tyrosine kinase substrate
VKNCGSLIHEEVATKVFMEELRELLKHSNDESTKKKILEMLVTVSSFFKIANFCSHFVIAPPFQKIG